MLDLKFVCDNIETVEKKLKLRNSKVDLTEVISLAAERRSTIKESEALKARKNAVSAQIAVMKRNKENADALIAEMKEEGEKIKALDERLAEVEARLNELMYTIPNLIDDSVPYGTDSSENV